MVVPDTTQNNPLKRRKRRFLEVAIHNKGKSDKKRKSFDLIPPED